VLGPREFAVYQSRRRRFSSGHGVPGNPVAAKEAISKAVGLGMRLPMTWRAANRHEASGAVRYRNGPFAAFLEGKRLRITCR